MNADTCIYTYRHIVLRHDSNSFLGVGGGQKEVLVSFVNLLLPGTVLSPGPMCPQYELKTQVIHLISVLLSLLIIVIRVPC